MYCSCKFAQEALAWVSKKVRGHREEGRRTEPKELGCPDQDSGIRQQDNRSATDQMHPSAIAQGQGRGHSVLEAIPPVYGQTDLSFLARPQVSSHLYVYTVGSIPMRPVHHRQPTNEARAETKTCLGYALQGGRSQRQR